MPVCCICLCDELFHLYYNIAYTSYPPVNNYYNDNKIRTIVATKTNKYLGKIEANPIKHTEMKGKQVYYRITRKLLKTKLHNRNLIKEINTWTVILVKYSGPFVKSTREDIRMDQRTKKRMAMHKTLNPRHDVNRLF